MDSLKHICYIYYEHINIVRSSAKGICRASAKGEYYAKENQKNHRRFIIDCTVEEAIYEMRSSANRLDFETLEGYLEIDSQSFTLENVGNAPIDLTPEGVEVSCGSTDFNVIHSGNKITVVPVHGIKEGVYETTVIIRSKEHAEQLIYVDITLTVGEKPIIYGDVDDDGIVTVTDVIRTLQYLASGNTILGPEL